MPFILILVAALMIMAAYNNAIGDLMDELETDIPGFLKWFLAIAAVGALGWVPGLSKISKMLLGLVLLVLVLTNYKNILAGFQALSGASTSAGATTPQTDPADAYLANPNNPQITNAEIAGTGQGAATAANIIAQSPLPGSLVNSGSINAVGQTAAVTSPYGAFDPTEFLAGFTAGFGGFGGVV